MQREPAPSAADPFFGTTQPAPAAKPDPATPQCDGRPIPVLYQLYLHLLPMPTVQAELNLTKEQRAKVKEVMEKAEAGRREVTALLNANRGEIHVYAETDTKMGEGEKKIQAIAEETKKTIESFLLPKQLERLKGLALQLDFTEAILDEEVQHDLKLSDDQPARIDRARTESLKKVKRDGTDPNSAEKMQQFVADWNKQMMDILTADQKASLEKMKGAKFEFPALGGRAALPPAKSPAETKGQP